MSTSPGSDHYNLRKRVTTPNKTDASGTRIIGWNELEKHNSLESCWIAIEDKVYDVTEWIPKHPGGRSAIVQVGGREVTDLIKAYHVDACWRSRVKRMYIGEFDEKSCKYKKEGNPAFAQDIRDFTKKMEDEGWYIPSASWYIKKTIQSLLLLVAAWACVIYGWSVGNVNIQYVGGFLVGCFWQQSNFLGHDAGHQAVIQHRGWNNLYGIFVGNIFAGLSIAWWRHSHYTHHVVTNVTSHDPDIQHLPVFAITSKFFTANHNKKITKFGEMFFWKLSKAIVSIQQYLFYPVMTIARINLHALSLVHVLTHENCPNRLGELFALGLFWVWWIFMLSFLPDTRSLVIFYYLSHLSVSLIHVQICVSHFLMETYDSVPMKKEDESVYEFQLRTTLDVNCSEYMDWIHGGLQYQAVHHIFPRLPRHRLREAQGHLIKICDKHHVKYHRYSFWEANVLTMKHMAGVAQSCSNGEIVKLNDTMIFNGFNCIG